MSLHDITRLVHTGMPVWPGDDPVEIVWSARRDRGHPANVASVRMGVHTGTHLDAPLHVIDGGASIGEIAPHAFLGPATLVAVEDLETVSLAIVRRILAEHPGASRLLLRTGAWGSNGRFPDRVVPLAPDAARELTRHGVILVGTDAPSVDPLDSEELPAHHELLGAGTCILENLLLDGIEPGEYELIALPLRLAGADGSPVRAVLRRP